MKLKAFALAALMGMALAANAQDDGDVARYGFIMPSGTARSQALGGATNALGADLSALTNNPAGLAIYNSDEFSMTPQLYNIRTNATYLGQDLSDQSSKFNFGHAGFVGTTKHRNRGKWQSVSHAFAITKLASFQQNISYSAYNRASSIGDYYASQLSGHNVTPTQAYNYAPFGAGLAYNAWLLDQNAGADSTNYTAVNAGGHVYQQMDKTITGGINELTGGLGKNYDDRLYMGLSFGLPIVRYHMNASYSESDDSLYHADFVSMTKSEDIKITGTGLNMKMGIIYRFNDFVRLGFALHTPTYYTLTDNSSFDMAVTRDTNGYHTEYSTNKTTYNIISPWRMSGGLVVTYPNIGFISADVEVVDHSSSTISYTSNDAASNSNAHDINRIISKSYTSANNIRLGAEAKWDIFAFRAGYAMYGSPYKTALVDGFDMSTKIMSAGLGMREKDYFFDLTFSHVSSTAVDLPYVMSNGTASPAATLTSTRNILSASVGFKF